MKKLLVVVGLVFTAACAPNYSNGTRIGVVTKLSERGLIYKSWEGSMLIALPSTVSAIQPEVFEFNVAESAVEAVKAAMASGKRVEVVYKQWAVSPPSIDHDHVVVGVREVQ